VLDIYSDPDVPPIPPHATVDEMTAVGKAILSGDEDAWGVVRTGVKHKMQEFLPGRKAD
jgi:pyruvate dehydrogenase (quinone)